MSFIHFTDDASEREIRDVLPSGAKYVVCRVDMFGRQERHGQEAPNMLAGYVRRILPSGAPSPDYEAEEREACK